MPPDLAGSAGEGVHNGAVEQRAAVAPTDEWRRQAEDANFDTAALLLLKLAVAGEGTLLVGDERPEVVVGSVVVPLLGRPDQAVNPVPVPAGMMPIGGSAFPGSVKQKTILSSVLRCPSSILRAPAQSSESVWSADSALSVPSAKSHRRA